jgi:hypothetical protein
VDRVDVQRLIRIMLKIESLLNDLTHEPTSALPSGLWQPLVDAIGELGRPSRAVHFDSGTGQLLLDEEGWPILMPTASVDSEAPLEQAMSLILEKAKTPANGRHFEIHGLVGPQLAMKTAVIDHAHAAYVAGGRLPTVPKNDDIWIRRQARRLRLALAPSATLLESMAHVPFLSFLGGVAEAVSGADHALALQDG